MHAVELLASWLITWSPAALILPLFLAIRVFPKAGIEARALAVFVFIASAAEAVAGVLWYSRLNNLAVLHLYTILEFFSLSFFYYLCLPGKVIRSVITVTTVLFLAFSIYENLFLNGMRIFNIYSRSAEGIIVTLYAVLLYIKEINAMPSPRTSMLLWSNTGFLLYFSGTFFLFIFDNSNDPDAMSTAVYKEFWAFHTLLMIILYSLISIGLWKVAFSKKMQ